MAMRTPHDGEKFEKYIAELFDDPDVRQRFPRGPDRTAALTALYRSGHKEDVNTNALSLKQVADATAQDVTDQATSDDDANGDDGKGDTQNGVSGIDATPQA